MISWFKRNLPVFFALVPLGLTNWIGFLIMAKRRRSPEWLAVGLLFLALLAISVILTTHGHRTGSGSASHGTLPALGDGILFASWVFGAVLALRNRERPVRHHRSGFASDFGEVQTVGGQYTERSATPTDQAAPLIDPYALGEEGRIKRSWRLTGVAWQLVRGDRTILTLALLGAIAATLMTVVFFSFFYTHAIVDHNHQGFGRLSLGALVVVFASILISAFFNVALASAADAALLCRPMTLGEALGNAVRRLDRIAVWALLSFGVGTILSQISRLLPIGGRITAWLVGSAWWLATLFVVPMLALEDTGAVTAVSRSARLARQRWGEGITGSLTIGAWMVVAIIPATIICCVGAGLLATSAPVGVALLVLGAITFAAAAALGGAASQVFYVALFRFATDGSAVGFSPHDLQRPFVRHRTKTFPSWLVYGLAGILSLAVILGFVRGRHHNAAAPVSPPARYVARYPLGVSSLIHVGTLVYYGHQRAGRVFNVERARQKLRVEFQVRPRFRQIALDSGLQLFRSRRDPSVVWFAMTPHP